MKSAGRNTFQRFPLSLWVHVSSSSPWWGQYKMIWLNPELLWFSSMIDIRAQERKLKSWDNVSVERTFLDFFVNHLTYFEFQILGYDFLNKMAWLCTWQKIFCHFFLGHSTAVSSQGAQAFWCFLHFREYLCSGQVRLFTSYTHIWIFEDLHKTCINVRFLIQLL